MKKLKRIMMLTVLTVIFTALSAWGAEAVILPDCPTYVEAEAYSIDTIDISWDYAYNAEGYRVFIWQNGTWVTLADTEYSYYTVENLDASTNYIFAIRSYVEYNNKLYWSKTFSVVSAATEDIEYPDCPTDVEAETYSADSIDINWEHAYNADGYRIFVRQNGKWVTLADTYYSYYTVENLAASTNYIFAVRSFVEYDDRIYWSKTFSVVSAATEDMSDYFYASAQEYGTKVTLDWDRECGASGYRVFRYNSGKWQKVKDLSYKYNTYTVTSLEIGKTYYFAVRPYAKTDTGVVWGALSNVCKIKTTDPYTVQITNCEENERSVTLEWKKVEDATGYRIFMYSGGKWKAIKTLAPKSVTNYTVTGLKSDTKYIFTVRAYKKVNGVITWYPFKSFKAVTPPSQSDLKFYRIAAYDKKFLQNFLLKMELTANHSYDISCYYARKNGYIAHNDYNAISFLGITRSIYDPNSKNLYWIYDDEKLCERYTNSIESSSPWPEASEREYYDVYIDEFNGETVVCESFYYYDLLYKCYFKTGELLGYDVECGEYTEGDWDGTYTVTQFTTDVPDSYFILPKGYKIYTY